MSKQHSTLSKGRNFTIESLYIVAVCGNKVECCFDKVERCFDNVACCFDIVAGVDGALEVRRTRLCVADGAFSVAGPRAWNARENALPTDSKQSPSRASFRKKLKTYVFGSRSRFQFICYYPRRHSRRHR